MYQLHFNESDKNLKWIKHDGIYIIKRNTLSWHDINPRNKRKSK